MLGEIRAAGGKIDTGEGNIENDSHSTGDNHQLEPEFPLATLLHSHRGLFGRNPPQFPFGADVHRPHRSRQTPSPNVGVQHLAFGPSKGRPFQREFPPLSRISQYPRNLDLEQLRTNKTTTLAAPPITPEGMIPEPLGQARID